jgi:hypothetical protein
LLKSNKKVYIKNYLDCNVFEPDLYIVIDVSKDFAIIKHHDLGFYRKVHVSSLTTDKKSASYQETFKKGDLVICIINNHIIQNGIIINLYKNAVLVLIQGKRKRISKNKVFIKK